MQHSAWHALIKEQLPEGYFAKINHFLDEVYASGTIYPPREKVFNAIQTTDLADVKGVILGQDPYHGPRQAQGLSFSVPDDIPAPPSLQNILKELADDIEYHNFIQFLFFKQWGDVKRYANENGIKETLLPVFIDSYITDSTLTGGINPQIGEDYIKTISILNFPGFSVPGMIDRLNRTDIEYIWGSRYIMLEKITIKKILDKYYNKWWAARLSFKDMFIEFFSKNETTNPNQSAMNAAIEVRDEKTKLDEDRDIVGYYTTTVILKNKNRDIVERQAQEVRTLLSSLGFVVPTTACIFAG